MKKSALFEQIHIKKLKPITASQFVLKNQKVIISRKRSKILQ